MIIPREQLELVVQKRKIGEVTNWFREHFHTSSLKSYIARSPLLIIQGPTGCGKTSVLKLISKELKIPIKEYSETTDTTAIQYDMAHAFNEEDHTNLSQSYDRRKAIRFEQFVINCIRFNTLYPVSDDPQPPSADSEFESDDDFPTLSKPPPPPSGGGVIIHVETLLSFARSQRILIQSLIRLLKSIKELSRRAPRRVAIVFEHLDCDREIISLPTKFKTTLGIQTIKFNPITRDNMRKFAENTLKMRYNLSIDKDTVDQLVANSDGDLRACLNSIEMSNNPTCKFNNVFMSVSDNELMPLQNLQVAKRQRLNPDHFKLNSSLMRDTTRSVNFFHVLGKIFYQKRIYPLVETNKRYRSIDRPYPTENSTESIVDRLDVSPCNLIAWLHHHYYKFCHEFSIEKASTFLEHLSDIDTFSINSTQSSQFYEKHTVLDQIQLYSSIESTVFSLYEDQSISARQKKDKKANQVGYLVKSSIESSSINGNGQLYSFNKPTSLSLSKLVEDHKALLECCAIRLRKDSASSLETTRVLLDYLPYFKQMSQNYALKMSGLKKEDHDKTKSSLFEDERVIELTSILDKLELDSKLDYDAQHEKLLQMIEEFKELEIERMI